MDKKLIGLRRVLYTVARESGTLVEFGLQLSEHMWALRHCRLHDHFLCEIFLDCPCLKHVTVDEWHLLTGVFITNTVSVHCFNDPASDEDLYRLSLRHAEPLLSPMHTKLLKFALSLRYYSPAIAMYAHVSLCKLLHLTLFYLSRNFIISPDISAKSLVFISGWRQRDSAKINEITKTFLRDKTVSEILK